MNFIHYTTLDDSDLKENFITTDSFKTVQMRVNLECGNCGKITPDDVRFVDGKVGSTEYRFPYCRKCDRQLEPERV